MLPNIQNPLFSISIKVADIVKFSGQILPSNKSLIYKLDIKRIIMRKLILGIANGKVICDDNLVYEAEDIRVGLFKKD